MIFYVRKLSNHNNFSLKLFQYNHYSNKLEVKMTTILIPLASGFEEIEAVSLIDVLRRAQINVIVASMDNNKNVLGANNITIVADREITGITSDDIDMILLPGGWGGTDILAVDENVQNLLKDMNSKNKTIGAMCAAPYALKCAGLLPENFTCYPGAKEKIRDEGYTDKYQVVEDGNIITSRGPGTAICFGLYIVKKFVGVKMYEGLRAGLLAEYCTV
jgi:4-methyl-5(b-hydroxyethyl)-thiazole monophosphate biosynthesis